MLFFRLSNAEVAGHLHSVHVHQGHRTSCVDVDCYWSMTTRWRSRISKVVDHAAALQRTVVSVLDAVEVDYASEIVRLRKVEVACAK